MLKRTKFALWDKVRKHKGDYGGPGEVVGILKFDGKIRYEVAFKIEGGFGRFIHIFNEKQLRKWTQK